MLKLAALVIFAYLLGSIPSAYIAAKLKKGFDIRKKGTRNAGATNVLLVVGPVSALLVYLFDLLKGLIPVLAAKNLIGTDISMGLCGLAAVIGHDFPVFVGFKGGKGVATTTGAIFGIHSILTWILIAMWVIFVALTDYFILASLLCMFYIPFLMIAFGLSRTYVIFGVLYFLVGLFTHRSDIVRIFSGKAEKAFSATRKYFRT